MILTVKEITEALQAGGIIKTNCREDEYITEIVTDSRKFTDGGDYSRTIFLGIKGEKFDGNIYAEAALSKGTLGIVTNFNEEKISEIEKKTAEAGKKYLIIGVEETLEAYGKLAGAWKKKLNIKTAAITGSVGKTTTKEVTTAVLRGAMETVKTKANFNNEVGVPMTLLSFAENTEAAVVEMGMRGLNQIRPLVKSVKPDAAVITNIGSAHLELLKTKDNTLRAKLEIASQMTENDTLWLNGDDEYLSNKEKVGAILTEYGVNPKIMYYGFNENNDLIAENIWFADQNTYFDLKFNGQFEENVKIPLYGKHNVYAALAGAGIGLTFGMSLEKIGETLRKYRAEDLERQRLTENNGVRLINDCYNACPESMKASLTKLKALSCERRIAFLGDMLELGSETRELHGKVGEAAAESNLDILVCVGDLARNIGRVCEENNEKTKVIYVENSNEAAKIAKEIIKSGDGVLVKGSHAVGMEIIFPEGK